MYHEESTMTLPEPAAYAAKSIDQDSPRVNWELSPTPAGASILTLNGDLKPGWLGRLSSHLSYNMISMTSGSARKSSALCWDASFEIDVRYSDRDKLKEFDPLCAVIAANDLTTLPTLKLTDFQVERSTRHGGSVYVEICGKDCIGFLYRVLRIFSFYSLFPIELEISTSGLLANDRFWLKGIGSAVPAKEDMTALHERLAMMLVEGFKK